MIKEQILKFIPDFDYIEESNALESDGFAAYHVSVISKQGRALGSGFSQDKSLARKIAICEAVERQAFKNLANSNERSDYLIDHYPSTCGFAVGSTPSFAIENSVSEAVERWVRSKWIDEHFFIEQVSIEPSFFSKSEKFFLNHFTEVNFFRIQNCLTINNDIQTFDTLISVCFTSRGAFVGSDTKMNKPANLEHALLESWRHLQIAKEEKNFTDEAIVIKYFADNKTSAIEQIQNASKTEWPDPKLRLLKEVLLPINGLYCYRALCHNFKGWHGSDYKRFVY